MLSLTCCVSLGKSLTSLWASFSARKWENICLMGLVNGIKLVHTRKALRPGPGTD